MNRNPSSLTRYRWAVASRTLAAFGGGYVLSAAFAASLGLVLVHGFGQPRVDAVSWGSMLSFVVFSIAVLWAFDCSSAVKAWVGIAAPSAVMLAMSWWLYGGQA